MAGNSNIAAFFKDPDASDAIAQRVQYVAPIVRGQTISDDELTMGGGIRIVCLVFDRSPSMIPAALMVLDGFNNDFVPAVKDARQDDISVLRIGGMSFSSDVTRLWIKGTGKDEVAFHAIDDLPTLTSAEYDPNRGNMTALHQSIIDATAYTVKYAAGEAARTGTQPEIEVVHLSDGMNNLSPMNPSAVRKIIDGSRKDLVRHSFLYFDHSGGDDQDTVRTIEEMVLKMGYDRENIAIFSQKRGESQKDYRSRFRRLMRVASRISASKGSSAVVAAAQVAKVADPDDLM